MWSNQENRVRKQVKNPCEARKIKASQNLHKIISTHLLTVLIIGAIVQLEQRKRNKRNEGNRRKVPEGVPNPELVMLATLETTSRVLMAAAKAAHKNLFLMFQ